MPKDEALSLLADNFPALCGENSLLTGKTLTFDGPLTGLNPDSDGGQYEYAENAYSFSSPDVPEAPGGHLFNVLIDSYSDGKVQVRGLLPLDQDLFATWCTLPPAGSGGYFQLAP